MSWIARGLVVLAVAAAGCAALSADAAPLLPTASITVGGFREIQGWTSATDNRVTGTGTLRLGDAPVAGVRLRIDGYLLPDPTDAAGRFSYRVDGTALGRHLITVADASHASRGGVALTAAQQRLVSDARGAASVGYAITKLKTSRNAQGQPVVTGVLVGRGVTPPSVALFSYRLTGVVLDSDGRPVAGARVSTRTRDRDYWTLSGPSDAQGRFSSLFTASSEASENPVGMAVRVAVGDRVYSFLPDEFVEFARLQSARLVIRLPPAGYAFALPTAQSYPGAVYRGILVGGTVVGAPIRPVSTTWPDAHGAFRIVFPRRFAGRSISLWEGSFDLFAQAAARPGGTVDLGEWPTALSSDVAQQVAAVKLR